MTGLFQRVEAILQRGTGGMEVGQGEGRTGMAVLKVDETLGFVSPLLTAIIQPWDDPAKWWTLVRGRIDFPAATVCAACGKDERHGSVEALLSDAHGTRTFQILFSGHNHDLSPDGGDLLAIRDVSAIRLGETALQEKVRQYRLLCETIQDVYFRIDPDGSILFMSPSTETMLDYKPEELLGKPFSFICLDPDYWDELRSILEGSDTVNDFSVTLLCNRGNQVPATLNAYWVSEPKKARAGIEGVIRDMTERDHLDGMLAERTRRLQETLAELEHQKFALDQHAIVSVTDADGVITYANRKCIEISQYSLDELKGRNHNLLNSGYHADAFFKEMWGAITGGRVWNGEIKNRKKDGSHYWIECTIVPFMTPSGKPYQFVAISTDISERIHAESRLEQSRSFLLSITDAMGEGVYVLDLQGRLTFMNREAERLLGWKEEELLGKDLHNAIHYKKPDGSPLPAEECPVHHARLAGETARIEEDVFIKKDGTMFPVSYVTAPFMVEGSVIDGSVAVFADITERKAAVEQLKRAHDVALEASRLKSEFLANMSHEIRTPMNAIIGMTDLLMDTPLNEEQADFSEIVRDSAHSLLLIINDILDFSKIEAGKVDIESIPFSPLAVTEGTAELLAPQAQEKGLSLMTFVSPEIPETLLGDPGRLRQTLLNLTGNAIKFTDDGEVVVRAEWVAPPGERARVRFSVRDTGIGLSGVARRRLFQPFTQADGSTNRRYGGTGLGLAISKRLVELMGGEMGLESTEGMGSTFWFEAEFKTAPSDEAGTPIPVERSGVQGVRALIVSANTTDRGILRAYLEAEGVVTAEAAAREEADRILAEGGPFHFVIAADALAGSGPGGGAGPWVVLGDEDDREWAESRRDEGFAAVLSKPVRRVELMDTLCELLNPEGAKTIPDAVSAPVTPEPERNPDAYEALESGKLLLLAEDNPVNQKVARMQLKKLGFAVHAVKNGKEAVEASSQLPYALILMDCQMPVMDGFEATRVIRRQEAEGARRMPIIAMTANAMKGDRERCLNAGMDDYLSKPVAPEELREMIEVWLTKSAGELPVVDIHQLRQLFGEDDETIRSLLQAFIASAGELLEKIGRTVDNRDAAPLGALAHELKGACVNVGALALAQAARQLEKRAENPDWRAVAGDVGLMRLALTRVDSFLKRY